MPNMNKAMIMGHLGRDAELRTTTNGKQVCTFTVATSEKYNDQEKTEWHRIVAWGKSAEIAADLKKGDPVFIDGKIQTRKWEDADGNQRETTEIVAWGVHKLARHKPPPGRPSHHPGYSHRDPSPPENEVPF